MLVERGFAIGGGLVIFAGVLMVLASVEFGLWPEFWMFPLGGAMMMGFGVFFLYVARQARHDRLALLRLGE